MRTYKIKKSDGTSLDVYADRFQINENGDYTFFAGESLVYHAQKSNVSEVVPLSESEDFSGFSLIKS